MRTTILSLLVLMVFASFVIAIGNDEFEKQWNAADGKDAKLTVAQQAVRDADDIDVIRAIQDTWESYDAASAMAHFESLLSEEESAQNLYLVGRLQATPMAKIDYARRALTVDPTFIYGYRLVVVPYMQNLFNGDEDGEYFDDLKSTITRDIPVIKQATDLLPDSEEAWGYLLRAQSYKDDFAGQLETLAQGKRLEARWASVQAYTNAYVGLGDYKMALQKLDEMLAETIEKGRLEPYLLEEVKMYRYANALENAGAWSEAVRYFSSYDNEELVAMARVYVAAAQVNLGNEKKAFKALQKAIDLGFDSQAELFNMSEFEAFYDEERWTRIVDAVKENRVKSAPKRRAEALAGRMDSAAPELPLLMVDGTSTSLADLKGQVIVIDFWATWCGPCRMAMPEIDEFTEKYADKDVTVISLNVWENVPEKAKKFITDNEYDMQLMWAEGDVKATDLFEVTGIPTLIVIDKDGVIRFKEVGYEEGLAEKLGWFADELL
jgi:thiol-disulfide isomerase/thioredoxin